MKRCFSMIAALVISFFVVGCMGVTVNSTTTTTEKSKAYKMGRVIGVVVGIKFQKDAKVALPYAKDLLKTAQDGTITNEQITEALDMAIEKLGGDENAKIAIGVFKSELDISVQTGKVNQNVVDALQGVVDGATPYLK